MTGCVNVVCELTWFQVSRVKVLAHNARARDDNYLIKGCGRLGRAKLIDRERCVYSCSSLLGLPKTSYSELSAKKALSEQRGHIPTDGGSDSE